MQLDEIYVVHHSHTDIGFTVDQPIFWELQERFLLEALDLVDEYRDAPPDSAFRWTVETSCQLEAFLERAPAREIDRLVRAEKEGFIEVTAMFADLTPLADARLLVESLRPALRLRSEYGFDIRFAMNCDVNGHNWILPDLLLDAGIEGFSMAVNHHFGGAPDPRPEFFLWEAPSGRLLPALNGWQYSKALDFGIGDEDEAKFRSWLPKMEARLESVGCRLPFFVLQGYHPFGDNGGAWRGYADFARRWNEAGNAPKIVCATPRTFWERLRPHQGSLPVRRGDWTDYWNFGCISTARETAVSRSTRERLTRADAFMAAAAVLGGAAGGRAGGARAVDPCLERSLESYRRLRDGAWRDLVLFSEHTWGGDEAAERPQTEDSLAMEAHKKAPLWRARSGSLLLERDALAELARRCPRAEASDLLVANPLPWPRVVCGPIARNVILPRGLSGDATAGRHNVGRGAPPTSAWTGREGAAFYGNMGPWLPPTEVPAFGWKVVGADSLEYMLQSEATEEAEVESSRFCLRFDGPRGALVSIVDKATGRELVDPGAALSFHAVVREEVAERDSPRKALFEMDWTPDPEERRYWKPGWEAIRELPGEALSHAVYRLPFGAVVERSFAHPGLGLVWTRIFLPDYERTIVLETEWTMGVGTHPEASYVALPLALARPTVRFDCGGVPVALECDQLPGVNRDYFTTQAWVDLNDGERGFLVATPDNPMVQVGGFSFARNADRFAAERALFLGWVTSNYWETNFPGRQPGLVTTRYAITPYEGPFDPARAYALAAQAAHAAPSVHHMGERPAPGSPLPREGSWLALPEPPVLVLSARLDGSGGIVLDLMNSSEEPRSARVAGGALRIEEASLLDFRGGAGAGLPVSGGAVEIELGARRAARLRLLAAPAAERI